MAEVTAKPQESSLTCLDLFCGCGGFSLGMQRAGFRVLAAIDFNEEAVATLKANLGAPNPAGLPPVKHALRKDLTTFTPDKLATKLGVNTVDVIVGGPPCQGFSTVRQVDAANHGSRVKRDKRRYLFRCFLDYVAAFRPKVFVMENVLGIQSAAKGKFFTLVQAEARKLKYRVHPQVEEAWKLGVPQKRRRQLIIGVREDLPGYFPGELTPAKRVFTVVCGGSRNHDPVVTPTALGCHRRFATPHGRGRVGMRGLRPRSTGSLPCRTRSGSKALFGTGFGSGVGDRPDQPPCASAQ